MNHNEHIQSLNAELQTLDRQMAEFAKLTKEATLQYEHIKQFGLQQTSFFMSAHTVFQKLNEEKELHKEQQKRWRRDK